MALKQINEPTMPVSPLQRFEEESQGSRLARKAREAPFVPLGLAGLTGVVLYGAYKFRTRGQMSTSVFLMQLRVAAQGTVVACLTAGLMYSMARQYIFHTDDQHKEETKEH
ncbi:HIG1 domain family member 1A, mitochondrial isoform X2 [Anabrus simplex]|uniref:HIG1 domain family member 1A, mitochondrial isoform X2 n=1 Tax=Anabrus simplex TaxID=316456 RepID=UPI0035A270C9